MKPPQLERLRKEDLEGAPEWFDRVLYIVNRFLESVVQLFSKNLNYQDNFDAQVYTDKINQSGITSGYSFRSTTQGRPIGLQILKIVKDGDTFTSFTVAPWVNWSYADGLITIHEILGIDSTSNYDVTLLVV